LQSLGVLCNSCCLLSDFKDSEVAEFQAAIFGEFGDNLVEKMLNDGLDGCLPTFRFFGYFVDQVFLCYRCHQLILGRDSS